MEKSGYSEGLLSKEEIGLTKNQSIIEALSFSMQQKYIDDNELDAQGGEVYDFESGELIHKPSEKDEDDVAICIVNGTIIRGSREMRDELNKSEAEQEKFKKEMAGILDLMKEKNES